jgi:hypothetical protein
MTKSSASLVRRARRFCDLAYSGAAEDALSDDRTRERTAMKAWEEAGRWVVVNDDFQDDIPAGLTALIARVYQSPAGFITWDLWCPEAARRVAVPARSQLMLPDVSFLQDPRASNSSGAADP